MTKLLRIKTLVAILACMAAIQAQAYNFEKDGIYYNISGSTVTVTYKDANYNSYSGTVNIPATVTNNGTTYSVTAIGPSAFQGCTNLMRVVIPNSVKYIMNDAFNGCTNLRCITIPASVYTIYNNVFAGCTSLRLVICLSTTAPNWYPNNFSDETYEYGKLLVPSGCMNVYQSSIYCWQNFEQIEEIACDFVQDAIFYDDLGNNQVAVRNVSDYIECYSGDIVIPQTVTNNGTTYTVTSVAPGSFYYGYRMTSIVLPSTINEIGTYAFFECISLTDVVIPDGVKDINYCTFGNCHSLLSVTIPSSVTWIAQNAFINCNSLSNITCWAATPPMCVDSSCFPSAAYTNATLTVPSTALNDYLTADVWQNFSNIIGKSYDFEVNGIYYIITGPNTASVTYKDTDYNSYSGNVTIPTTVTHNGITYTVTAIGRNAFRICSDLTGVSIPSTVTMIDYSAFYKCTSLTSVVIPNSVTELGEFCFMSCSALQTVTIGNGITSIPRQCFTYCSSLHTISWPSTITEIGHYAFYNCESLGSLILPDDLETIMPYALANCIELSGVTIPAEVTSIGDGVFSGCTGLYYIGVAQSNQHYTSLDGCLVDISCDTLIAYPNKHAQDFTIPSGVKIIGPAAFGSCDNLLSVTFPEGVTSIETSAFSGCVNLQSVMLSSSVTNIGRYAFDYCVSLTSFYIPANIATIGTAAFSQCAGMTAIHVDGNNPYFMDDDGVLYTSGGTKLLQYPCGRPDKHYSVLNTTSSIDEQAFAYTNVKSVYLPKSLRAMDYLTFGYSSLERIVIDEGLEDIPERAFYACQDLKSVYLPSTTKSIGDQAFYYSVGLEELTFAVDGDAPTIGENAFYGLAYYTDNMYALVYVPNGMAPKYDGLNDWLDVRGSFVNISPLDSEVEFTVDSLNYITTDANLNAKVISTTDDYIVDPGISPKVAYQGNLCTVTMLQDHAFAYLTKMVRADVPFTIQQIDDYCFYDCRNLEKLILRDGIRQIDGYAFAHINKLTSVEIPASVDSISGNAFIVDPALRYINAPDNNKYTSVDGVLFSKDRKLLVSFPDGYGTSYTVPFGTRTIGREAFRGDNLLEHVALPTSLLKIDGNAFTECSALSEIVVPKGVTVVENAAFSKCTSMTEAELPETLTELGYNAFNNVTNLSSLTVKATTPPTCRIYLNPRTGVVSEPFMENHYTSVTLYVPRGSKSAYQQANIWKKFTNIVEVDFPVEVQRGDVNGDGNVNITDVTLLISAVLNDDTSAINVAASDVNNDGNVNISDITMLISFVLNGTWPETGEIDLWHLWGNFFGSDIWGWQQSGIDAYGVSVLPMYPTGTFNAQGKGILTWTGYVPRQYFTIIHTPGADVDKEMWVKDLNTGNYCVRDMSDNDPNYSSFLMDPGFYTITLDTRSMSLSIEPYLSTVNTFAAIAMAGNYNDWANNSSEMSAATPRILPENHDWWVDDFTVTSSGQELKFSQFDNWFSNWGDVDFPYGTGEQGGQNIVLQPGTYKVFFNDISGQYHFIKK